MKKKDKKKLKQKDKVRKPGSIEILANTQELKHKVKQLEKELKQRESIIKLLNRQLKKSKGKQEKKRKSGKSTSKVLFTHQTNSVAIAQKIAWKRHGYLRDRYEFHLGSGQDKSSARNLADKDLRDEFGEGAGYSVQELEQILS